MDRNDYYEGESTSFNLNQLWKRFRGSNQSLESLGASKEYNFIITNGGLVHVLILTNVTKYLNFKVVNDYEDNDPKSHEGLDLIKVTTKEVIAKYGLEDDTIHFIGYALGLHLDDSYLDQQALNFVKRMKLYAESLARFQGGSPYIYPFYGLAELPQSFAHLSVVYGGPYMLNKLKCKVEFDENGKAIDVTSEGETARCKKVICDPSYLPNKTFDLSVDLSVANVAAE
ncbi:hypothetical protein H0E87_028527 [Populus deltoides]|uniref:Guanosine nucleotide diphosphate dissociation inhibitor n=1 Tax=Populus deltoides TaxID=3696 RepID=A0A8T2WS57_POPDE|nr:hypothetical protein H0E87_028527 [Populus deltoides]